MNVSIYMKGYYEEFYGFGRRENKANSNPIQACSEQRRMEPNADDRFFVSFGKWINTAELIREDLVVAGIELTDREGNAICFHSLRNSYISFLVNSRTSGILSLSPAWPVTAENKRFR